MFTIGDFLAAVLAIFVTSFLWLPWFLEMLADHNFLITSLKEGSAKAIMSFGEFSRLVMAYKGYYFNTNWDVMRESDTEGTANHTRVPDHWIDELLPGGLRWVGLPFANKVYDYHFQWTSIRQGSLGEGVQTGKGVEAIVEQKNLEDLLVARDERPDYIVLKRDVYGITIQDTEDKDLFPVSAIALLTGRIVNPYKALFNTEQWLEQVTNFLRPYLKEYIGGHSFQELVTASKKGEENALAGALTARAESDEILGLPSPDHRTVGEYICAEWGFRIEHLNLVNFKTVGKLGEAFQTAAATKFVKHQEAVGIMEIADAEAYRITTVADAIEKKGETGLFLRGVEAYEEASRFGNQSTIIGSHPVSMLVNAAKPENRTTKPPEKNKEEAKK